MKQKTTTWLTLALLMIGSGTRGGNQAKEPGRRVTDPEVLAHYGLKADAILYIAPGAEVEQRASGIAEDEQRASALRAAARNGASKDRVGYVTHNGAELRGVFGAAGVLTSDMSYHPEDGQGNIVHYLQLRVPNGARFQGVRWWVLNEPTGGEVEAIELNLFRHCVPAESPGEPVITLLATGGTNSVAGEDSGFLDLTPDEAVDNVSCTYNFVPIWSGDFHFSDISVRRLRAQYTTRGRR